MIHGNYDISKVTAEPESTSGTVYMTILDDDGHPLTTPDVVVPVTLPDPGPDPAGPPEVTESGLIYGSGSMTSAELVAAIDAALET